MANRPNEAIVEWLRAEKTRANDVVVKACEGHALALEHLTFALIATADLAQMRELMGHANPKVRLSALTAISRTAHSEDDARARTVSAASALIDAAETDTDKAHILAAAILPFVQAKVTPTNEAISAASRVTEICGPATVHVASQVLFASGAWCPTNLGQLLFNALRQVQPQNNGTVDLIDGALRATLKGDCADAAIQYVEDMVGRENDALPIGSFDSFTTEWIEKRRSAFDRTLALWLASGKRRLCQAVADLIAGRDLRGTPLNVDVETLGLNPAQRYLMCGKAVGYLFMQPVAAASILVATLRSADADLASAIKQLLIDPLIVSFSGATLQYLEALPETDRAYPYVADVLAQARAYLAGIHEIQAVRELHPSEYQRQLERIRDANLTREILKDAHRRSIFHDIVHRTVLLHGSGSVAFIEDGNGERRPVHMKLHGFSTTSEWPRMETLIPLDSTWSYELSAQASLSHEAHTPRIPCLAA